MRNWKKRRGRPVESCRRSGLGEVAPGLAAGGEPAANGEAVPEAVLEAEEREAEELELEEAQAEAEALLEAEAIGDGTVDASAEVRGPGTGSEVVAADAASRAGARVRSQGVDGAVDAASAVARTRWCRRSANCSKKGRKC